MYELEYFFVRNPIMTPDWSVSAELLITLSLIGDEPGATLGTTRFLLFRDLVIAKLT